MDEDCDCHDWTPDALRRFFILQSVYVYERESSLIASLIATPRLTDHLDNAVETIKNERQNAKRILRRIKRRK